MLYRLSKLCLWMGDALALRVIFGAVCAVVLVSLTAGKAIAGGSGVPYAFHNNPMPEPAHLFVSPEGNGNNSGLTSGRPLGSISEAQKVVRQWISKGTNRDIVVYLEGGTYRITSPVRFGPRDSGNNGHTVIWRNYPGQSPVLSGGTPIAGWSERSDGVWSASAKGLNFLQLYGPDGRISPAKTRTLEGQLYTDAGSNTVQVKVANAALANWNISPLAGVQVVMQLTWRQLRYRIASISADENGYRWIVAKKPDGTVNVMAGIRNYSPTNPKATSVHQIYRGQSPVFMEYAKQFMTANSFWLDVAANKVYWRPPAGVDANSINVTAPVAKRLVIIDGASNLTFYGLQFEYTTWLRPAKDGNMERQGGFRAEPQAAGINSSGWPIWYVNPGAVTVENGSNITFRRDAFRYLGANGVVFGEATDNDEIADSIFKSISDTGVFVGSAQDPTLPTSKQNIDTIINDNVFDNMGEDYATGSAITATFPNGLTIAHNLIRNVPNIGINIGYIDNLPPVVVTSLRNIHITDNRINRVCTVAADCGAIHTKTNFYYSNSKNHMVPRSTINGNYIIDVHRNPYQVGTPPVMAIYLDNDTNGLFVTKNVWANVDIPIFHNHNGRNTVMDNGADDQYVIGHAGLLPSEKRLATIDLDTTSLGDDRGPGLDSPTVKPFRAHADGIGKKPKHGGGVP